MSACIPRQKPARDTRNHAPCDCTAAGAAMVDERAVAMRSGVAAETRAPAAQPARGERRRSRVLAVACVACTLHVTHLAGALVTYHARQPQLCPNCVPGAMSVSADRSDAASLRAQIVAVQRQRVLGPTSTGVDAAASSELEAASTARAAGARQAAAFRVGALLRGAPSALLTLAGQRASQALTPDQRLGLEDHLLSLEVVALAGAVPELEAQLNSLPARESAARASLAQLMPESDAARAAAQEARVRGVARGSPPPPLCAPFSSPPPSLGARCRRACCSMCLL